MVTKQQQLEWLASKIVKWPADGAKIPVSVDDAGNPKFYMPCDAFAPWDVMRVDFTREEWQQERDKMQKQSVQEAQSAQPATDSSWHERWEFPPAGCECEAEYDTNRKEWHKVRIIGVDNGECFFRWLSGASNGYVTGYKRNIDFRPLRTEREKAIDAACAAVCKAGPYDHERELIGKLYDAGMLK